MNILSCSKNDSVLKRWHNALGQDYRLHQAGTPEAAYRIMGKIKVDLILLHRSMVNEAQISDLSGFKPAIKIFILSDRPGNEEGFRCLKIGCVGYANTYISAPRLKLAAQTVLSGLVWTGTSLMQYLIRQAAKSPSPLKAVSARPAIDPSSALSKREYQIASLVAEGLRNKEIAERLAISERTVKAHLSSVYAKTATSGRLGLAKVFNG